MSPAVATSPAVIHFAPSLTRRQTLAWHALHDDGVSEVLYGGAKGGGKAQSLNAVLYTTNGEIKMRDVKIGDLIACPDGSFSPVIAVHPQGAQRFFRVTFIDGRSALATEDHLWYAKIVGRKNKHSREFSIYTTAELIEFLKKAKKSKSVVTPNILVPLCKPVNFTPVTNRYSVRHRIDPYVLGVLLGDGCLTHSSVEFVSEDDEIVQSVKVHHTLHQQKGTICWCVCDGGKLRGELEYYGLLGHRAESKFIPEQYKICDVASRLDLIRGLFDTDGYADNRGHIQYTTVSERLALDVQWIIRSLGGKATITSKIGKYRDKSGQVAECQRVYMLYVNIVDPSALFRLSRKKDRASVKYNGGNGNVNSRIVSIEYEKDDLAQCITLRDPNGLYLTDGFIVTHNSVFGCFWVFLKALEVIREYDLKPTSFPIPIAFMGRKQGVDFVNTTLETWKRFIPAGAYRIKEQAHEIIIGDAVKIDFGGMDSQEAVQKFNSAEYAYFFLDQAEEVTQDDIAVLRASLRLVINGRQCKAKALLTANPARCWLRDEFITAPRVDQRYIQALPSDNPYLDETYLEILRQSFKHRPELLAAYLEGSWDSFEGMDQVIRDLWLRDAMDRKRYPAEPQDLVVCDPARFGDDETVIYDMKDTQIIKETVYGKKDTMYTANVLFTKQRDLGGCPVAVDTIGIGAGIGDRLVEMGCNVISINASKKASDVKRFYNLRAEMWVTGAEQFAEGDVALSHEDPVLRGQLCTPTYKFRNGRILIEGKDDIKKRLGRSPDRADAYIMGLYAMAMLLRFRASEGLKMLYPKPASSGKPPATSYQARVDAREEEARRRSQW